MGRFHLLSFLFEIISLSLCFFEFFCIWRFLKCWLLNCFSLFNLLLFISFEFFDHWNIRRWVRSISFDLHLYIGFNVVYAVHLAIAFKHPESCWKHQKFSLLKLALNLLDEVLRAVKASHALARFCCVHCE